MRAPKFRSALLALALTLTAPALSWAEEEPAFDPAQAGAALIQMLNTLQEEDVEGCREAISRMAEIEPERRMGLLHAYASVAGDSIHPFRREILDIVLDRFGTSALRSLLHEAVAADSTLVERTLALRLVRERDVPGAMDIVLTAGVNEDPKQLRRPFVQRSLRESIAVVLEREPSSAVLLERRFPDLPAAVQDAVLDVFETRLEGFGTREMSRFLGSDARLNRSVLPRLVRLPITSTQPLQPEAESHVAWSLESDDAALRRLAALSIGHFHMTSLKDGLLNAMDDPDPRVAAAAQHALLQISGARLLARRDLWEKWMSEEQSWADTRLDEAVADALSEDAEVATAGLERLTQHRFHREQTVPRLDRAALHASPAVRRTACETLGTLGSPRAIQILLHRLDDDDASVVAAAQAALQRITRLPAQESAADWSALLDG